VEKSKKLRCVRRDFQSQMPLQTSVTGTLPLSSLGLSWVKRRVQKGQQAVFPLRIQPGYAGIAPGRGSLAVEITVQVEYSVLKPVDNLCHVTSSTLASVSSSVKRVR
jgi:hypothetical protein